MMRDGCKLSYNALPSLKNSGEKIILLNLYFFFILSVYPTGIVDLITMVAFGFNLIASLITESTEDVSK